MTPDASLLPGLDLARLDAYLRAELDAAPEAPLTAELIVGGRSNLTYSVTDGRQVWIVRRPPLGAIARGLHDVAREFVLLNALAATDIPVPRAYLLCEDVSVLGAPFIVTEFVPGRAFRAKSDLVALGTERTAAIVLDLVDVLARLHSVDPRSVGLAEFGRPAGFLERQIRRWERQLDAVLTREVPGLKELVDGLFDTLPARTAVTIVHGDYRLDNVLVDENDTIRAVLDWEMATLGDPMTDLGLLVARNRDVVGEAGMMFDVNSAPGHPTTAQMVDHYAQRSGRDVSHIKWYIALANLKRAAGIEGIRHRERRADDTSATLTAAAIAAGLAALAEYGAAAR